MTLPVSVSYLGEGASDIAIARRLICAAGGVVGKSYLNPIVGTGKQSLDSRLSGLNRGVEFGNPVLIVRDLDSDAECAGALVANLLSKRNANLILRICVRESEAWLLADAPAYSRYAGIPMGQMPKAPEELADPKRFLIALANQGKAPKLLRHLEETSRRAIAPYRALGKWHSDFASELWDPLRAASSGRSPSLFRALTRLRECVARG